MIKIKTSLILVFFTMLLLTVIPTPVFATTIDNNCAAGIHSYERTVLQEATCTTPGLAGYACVVCRTFYTEETPALSHDYKEQKTGATCTESGSIVKTCSRCKDSIREAIPAFGHNWGDWESTTNGERRVCANNSAHIETRNAADSAVQPPNADTPATDQILDTSSPESAADLPNSDTNESLLPETVDDAPINNTILQDTPTNTDTEGNISTIRQDTNLRFKLLDAILILCIIACWASCWMLLRRDKLVFDWDQNQRQLLRAQQGNWPEQPMQY